MPLARGRNAPQNTFLETLAKKFDGTISNFVLGNAQSLKDYPIVYCSDGFCELTGYSRTEIMCKSCSCRFLVGLDTEKDALYKITKSLQDKTEMKTEILFYKKSGAPFWCLLDLMPIKNETGEVVLFLVSHKDVTKQKLSISEDNINSDSNSLGNGFVSDAPVPRLRKFSRDVLLHIQRQYSSKGSMPKNRNTFSHPSTAVGESSSFIPQYKLENAKLPRFMILHFGRPRLIWDWIILILVCYIAIMVPFNVAFKTHDHTKELIIADTIVELFFIVDIAINFRTTYIDKKSGRIITQKKLIAMHYLKGWFVIDFLAALPFEALYFTNHSWGFLVSLMKTGRLLRLFRIARRISRYIEYTAALLGLLMFSFALLGHWFACIWYVIGYEELKNKQMHGWLYGLGEQMGRPYINGSVTTGPSKGEAYISSLYFILTSLTTVGFGNIAPNTAAEKIFSVVVLLLGALMQSAIFGNMTAIIQKLYSVRARFHAKANEIKQFVRLHRIENDLKRRIEDYFLTHWSVSKGVDTDEMLESFPSELRADICLHMYKNFLGLSCFSDTSRGCWRLLSLKVKRAYFGPGELILKEKDAIDAIFFVNSGTIEIVQRECIVAILGSGDLFGEDVSRKLPIRRSNGDVRALTYCDLLYLSRANLLGVLHLYPDFAEMFSQKLEMTFNLGIRERDLSNCGPLDSITEGDEEDEESESTEDDAHEERTLLSDNGIGSPISPQLPLWQRRIRNMESQSNSVASLQERLMRIESESSDENSDHETPMTRDSREETSFLNRSFRGKKNKSKKLDNIELTQPSSYGNISSECHNEFPGSSPENMDLYSDEKKETSFSDIASSRNINGSDERPTVVCNELRKSIKRHDTSFSPMVNNQTQFLIESDTSPHYSSADSAIQHYLVDHSENNTGEHIVNSTRSGQRINRRTSKYEANELNIDYSDTLGHATGPAVVVNPKTSNDSLQRSVSSESIDSETQKANGMLESCAGKYNHNDIFPSNQSLDKKHLSHPAFEVEVDMVPTANKWQSANDMSWDMLCPSFMENHSESLSDIKNKTGINLLRPESELNAPKHKIERLSSGVFSRLSDSEPELNNSSDLKDDTEASKSRICSDILTNQNNHNRDPNGCQSSPSDEETKEFTNKFISTTESGDEQYLCEMQDKLTAEVRMAKINIEGIEKNLSTGNEINSFNQVAKQVSESQQAILHMTRRLDCISSDVEGLKKEINSIASMMRTLVERQSNN